MNRSKRSLRNLISSLGLNGVTILASFVATPIILTALGDIRFGLFRTIFEWIGFTSILSVSYLSFSSQLLARQKNLPQKNFDSLRSYFLFGLKLVIYLIPLSSIFIFASPYLMGAPVELWSNVRWSSLIACASLLFIPCLIFQSYLEADNRSYVVNSVMVFQRLAVILLSVLGAIQFQNIESQFLVLLLGQILFFIIIFRQSKIELKLFKNLNHVTSDSAKKSHWNNILPFVKIEAAGKLGMSADTIIISMILGPNYVTQFYLLIRLPSLFIGQLMSLGNSVWAGFAQVYKEGGDVKGLFLKLTKAVAILSSACGGSIFIFNSDFLQLWLSRDFEQNIFFNAVIGINVYFISLISFFGWMLTAVHGENEFAKASLVSSLANIFIGISSTFYFGLLGPLLGSLLGYGLIKMIWVIKALKVRIQVYFMNFVEIALMPLFFAGFYFYAIYFIRDYINLLELNWMSLILFGICTNVAYLFLAWFILLRHDEQKHWQNKILGKIGRA